MAGVFAGCIALRVGFYVWGRGPSLILGAGVLWCVQPVWAWVLRLGGFRALWVWWFSWLGVIFGGF